MVTKFNAVSGTGKELFTKGGVTFQSSGDPNNYKTVISLVRRVCRLSHDRFLFGKHCRSAINDYGDASTLRMAGHELQLGISEPSSKVFGYLPVRDISVCTFCSRPI